MRKRTNKQLQGCLFEFVWRRRNEGTSNLWNGLMAALHNVCYNKIDFIARDPVVSPLKPEFTTTLCDAL